MSPLVELVRVSKVYPGGVAALSEVDLAIGQGELAGVFQQLSGSAHLSARLS